MTQDDLVKDLSPKMGSIGESHQVPTIDAYGTYQSQMESRHRSSIEREIEQKVRAEVQYDLDLKMRDLNDKEAYLNHNIQIMDQQTSHGSFGH